MPDIDIEVKKDSKTVVVDCPIVVRLRMKFSIITFFRKCLMLSLCRCHRKAVGRGIAEESV